MHRFIYVFGEDAKNQLLTEDYQLLKCDTKNNVYIFVNKPEQRFAFNDIAYTLSDVLTY